MTRILSKWLRKIHRWIAVPTALAIPIALIIKLSGYQPWITAWEQLDRIPSLLMLVMALTGAYLFLLPYIIKKQRAKQSQTIEG